MKFRKKPVIIEAVQLKWDTWNDVCSLFDGSNLNGARSVYVKEDGSYTDQPITDARIGILIPTLEGEMLGVEGDWIIKGVKGEIYPCKPDIFEQTYEVVTNET